MYRLLICDDEPIIVEGLYELFLENRKHELGVYKAYSGEEVLDILNRNRIDVILTDIRMPGITGLQLLDEIRVRWPECRVIFLTGYSEFDYVYKAIQYSGVSYLLKTEGYEKIVEMVEINLEELDRTIKDKELLEKARENADRVVPLLQKEFVYQLLDGEIKEPSQDLLDELGTGLVADKPVILLVGSLDYVPDKLGFSDHMHYQYTLGRIAERFMPAGMKQLFTSYRKTYLVWLIQPVEVSFSAERQTIHLKGFLETVQIACKEALGVPVSFIITSESVMWNKLSERFYSLRGLFNYRMESGSELLSTDRELSDAGADRVTDSVIPVHRVQVHLKKLETLGAYLEQGRKQEYECVFNELKYGLKDLPFICDTLVWEINSSLALLFMSFINRYNLRGKLQEKVDLIRLLQPALFPSVDEMLTFCEELGDCIFEIQRCEYEARSAAAVRQLQKFIQQNLNENLSLECLADRVHFNPKYLSRLFKQVTGLNLSDYILEHRVNRARELLADNRLKIHEIALSVGYFSAPYFTRFFKKATSLSPQEYRNSMQKVDKR